MSPTLHRAAYAALGLDWRYDAIEVDGAGLPGFLAGLGGEWVGLSLTMPLKEAVLPYLAGVSQVAGLTGAANTVLFGPAGARGDNTDVFGIVAAVRAVASTPFPEVCVIGAGATARSAAAAAVELGARRVTVVARRPEAARATCAVAAACGADGRIVAWQDAATALGAPLVISAVPGDAGAALAASVPARAGVLMDVTYWPWPTSLATAWLEHGGSVVGGEQMLLWQAAKQVELMTGRAAPVDAMQAALRRARR